jgi:predicted nucleotidyltransferase
MNIFFEEHRKLIRDMLEEHVDFMLVGGYAVNYHGYNRTTGDMDIWLKPDNKNKMKVIRALSKNDIDPDDLRQIEALDFTSMLAFSAWDNPYKIDFLTRISGVTFEQANEEKIIGDVDGLSVPIINLNHLVLSKIATGRTQDNNDVEKLQEVKKKSR